ncbi:alpha-ketoglutarate-dependent dioxygenase AlkB family protein [Lacihabitans soyangensis]|uniref:Alpha-ketoglutarate-dependent dioxygenase AlkB n=1 Tax=Lacihabitans soyangensis TaxID=869394 RepID=A0AAE3H3M5_9BACT|nr:alpha-ketoglutarate-dependent dioxygenase AlkB [Lacihabitans soyangensis]MCP9762300.1 alpha-ketoglutarate-dependent dioxygenase AlkB [Lacihabitans soyangensis]
MSQLDIFGNPILQKSGSIFKKGITVIENGEYIFYPNFFSKEESDSFLKTLRSNIIWKQESMNMYGKKIDFPRLTAWYGNNDKPYSFSGITLQPLPWSSEILSIKSKIEPVANTAFNSVLLNLYRDGNDSISWHTDAEKELGINPVIASVNFGATRKFQLRHIKTKEKLEIELTHGSLLIMQGELQHFWQHQVPKTSKIVRERINLTFRVIK